MAYNSGKRPFELANKGGHLNVIKDPQVKQFLDNHELPSDDSSVNLDPNLLVNVNYDVKNWIEYVIAVDGGDTTVPAKNKFPSSKLTFFQFGANMLKMKDLETLSQEPFINPDSISKLKELERIKFTLPAKNISLRLNDGSRASLTYAARKAIFDFFHEYDYLKTLKWFLFCEYNRNKYEEYSIPNHPQNPKSGKITIRRKDLKDDFTVDHPDGVIFLIDVFRLHEAIDDELGAEGIIGYLRNVIEHFIIINSIKEIYERRKNKLKEVLFFKDGPLGFFGQTAEMHVRMRELINFLRYETEDDISINLVGVEKSGSFVEHAQEIVDKIEPGQALLLNNEHIYSYILPGNPESTDPYGRSSYYSGKVILKSRDEKLYVLCIPNYESSDFIEPSVERLCNFHQTLANVEKLRSDSYDNALLPITLVNKLVSLSDHPSSDILEKFAKESLNK